jgi:hypothetical protein
MGFSDYFESNYLAASDLCGKDLPVVIDKIAREKVGKLQESKPVMYLKGHKKGVVLNRTNFRAIAKILGPEDAKWSGGEVTLYGTMIEFEGEPRDAIRVRPYTPPKMTIQSGASVKPGGPNDDIPFNPPKL